MRLRTDPESLLFVYGTLLTGTGRPAMDRVITRALVPVSAATVPGKLYHLDGYPGALPDPASAQTIRGLIVRLRHPRLHWPLLDRYEECGNLYVRERVTALTIPAHRPTACWIYRYCCAVRHRRPVTGGDYSGRGERHRLSARKRRSTPRDRYGETYP